MIIPGGYSQCQQYTTDWALVVKSLQAGQNISSVREGVEGGWDYQLDGHHVSISVISEKAPFLLIALLCVVGATPALFLPETADLKMPDSLEDMKEFGR